MLKRLIPSPAMAVALAALFVALGGEAYAVAANSVGTAQIRDRAVTQAKLAHNSVWHAQIGRESVRNFNVAPNTVWHAELGHRSVRENNIATGAVDSRTIADHSVGATQLAHQPWHDVGPAAAGEDGHFQNGWHNAGLGTSPTPAGYTEDVTCVVHLRGQVAGGTVGPNPATSTVFTLPAGFRPVGGSRYFPVLSINASNTIVPGSVGITPEGQVYVGAGSNRFVSLDSISFSTEAGTFGQPSASAGCG